MSALDELLQMLNLQGRPVEIHHEPGPLVEDPIKGGLKHANPESEALMKLLGVHADEMYQGTEEVLNRVPKGRSILDDGTIADSV
jgi:hypothetical protein